MIIWIGQERNWGVLVGDDYGDFELGWSSNRRRMIGCLNLVGEVQRFVHG